MIVTGLLYNFDHLPQYLIREQKKAEKDHIEFSEFIGRSLTVVEDLERELYRLKNQKKLDLEASKNGKNDNSIDKQIEQLQVTYDFTMPLDQYTNSEFIGSIGFWDISKVREAINDAFDFYSIEKEIEDNGPTVYYQKDKMEIEIVKEKISTTKPHMNPYRRFLNL